MSVEQANAGFVRAMQAFQKKSGIAIWEVMRKAAFDLMRDVQLDTPVDTGRARAGWTPFFKAIGKPGITGGLTRIGGREVFVLEQGIAQAQGESEGSARLDEAALEIEIQNRVPYIVFLERGWSGQAPQGMVEKNLRAHARNFREMVKAAKVEG